MLPSVAQWLVPSRHFPPRWYHNGLKVVESTNTFVFVSLSRLFPNLSSCLVAGRRRLTPQYYANPCGSAKVIPVPSVIVSFHECRSHRRRPHRSWRCPQPSGWQITYATCPTPPPPPLGRSSRQSDDCRLISRNSANVCSGVFQPLENLPSDKCGIEQTSLP